MFAELKNTSKIGWRTVRFGDVVRNVDSSVKNPLEQGLERFVGLEHLDPESLHIKRWGNITDGTSFTRRFKPGQVLFGKRRAYQRKAAVAEFDGICSGDILVFEPKNEELLLEILPFIVQSEGFFDHALGTSAGSLSPRTKWSDMARYEFSLPSKDEQQRIAKILWAADDAIRKEVVLSKKLNDFFKTTRQDLINNDSFESTNIGSVCKLQGGSGFSPKIQGQLKGEVPFIKVSDMNLEGNEKYIYYAQNYVQYEQLKSYKLNVFPAESIVFSKVGAALLHNRRRILIKETCIDNNMMAAIVNENILSDYLYYFLLDFDFALIVQDGAIPSVNQQTLSNVQIKVPDKEKQAEIIVMLQSIENVINDHKAKLSALNNLKKILLTKVFSLNH